MTTWIWKKLAKLLIKKYFFKQHKYIHEKWRYEIFYAFLIAFTFTLVLWREILSYSGVFDIEVGFHIEGDTAWSNNLQKNQIQQEDHYFDNVCNLLTGYFTVYLLIVWNDSLWHHLISLSNLYQAYKLGWKK